MPRYATLAEQCRAHRAAFELALELGCTPREAEQILRDRTRTRRRSCGTRVPDRAADHEFEPLEAAPAEFSEWGATWMMRE